MWVPLLLLAFLQGVSLQACLLESEDSWNYHLFCPCTHVPLSILNASSSSLLHLQRKKFVHLTFRSCIYLSITLDQSSLHPPHTQFSLLVEDVYHLDLRSSRNASRPSSLYIRSKNISLITLDSNADFRVLKSLDGHRGGGLLLLNASSKSKEEFMLFERKIHGFSRDQVFILVNANTSSTSYKAFMNGASWKEFLGIAMGIFLFMVSLGSIGLVFIAMKIFRDSPSNVVIPQSAQRYSETFLRNLDINDLLSGIMCQSRRRSNGIRPKTSGKPHAKRKAKNLTQEVYVRPKPTSSSHETVKGTSFFSSVL